MDYEIEYEYEQFLADIKTGLLSHELYLCEDEYEDEYSHNDLSEAQIVLAKKIRQYLSENYPGKYCVFIDWCVRVMDVELAKKKQILHYERRIVNRVEESKT